MEGKDKMEMLLGKSVPSVEHYNPELLYPMPRDEQKRGGSPGAATMYGCDVWHAYELSWLGSSGIPRVRVGRFTFPADSACMVESKSFKLYLNSLNNHRFDTEDQLLAQVVDDLEGVCLGRVGLELFELEDPRLNGSINLGESLDHLVPAMAAEAPDSALVEVAPGPKVEEILYSNLLRSLCPVTAQPDWATVRIRYRGNAISRSSLLAYVLSYRNHQEFHEQCIERFFHDLYERCQPELLEIQGFYTRRGGLDINPFRSTDPGREPLPRLNRQ